jgi:acylpyruvate hydrolase
MRIVGYEHGGAKRIGLREGDHVRPFAAPDAAALFSVGIDDVSLGPAVDLADVRLLPPVWNPPKIVCVGINYADHAAETGRDRPEYPVLFTRFATTLVAHGEPLVVPRESEQLDYEGELVAVIGRGGRRIPREHALDHVAAWSIFDDASVRDFQRRTSQFTPGKNFDRTGGFGPELVTVDEVPPGASGLRLTTTVTTVDGVDEVLQDASTADLIFGVADLVAVISTVMTLEPGDVIVTGTPGGVGMARTPQRWLRPGERVTVAIEGIGALTNPVVADPA